MNIPDKAVEAARKTLLTEARKELGPRGDISSEGARFMKITLDAAAPFIAAQALRDAAWQAELDNPDDGVSPYWLRKRANEMEGK